MAITTSLVVTGSSSSVGWNYSQAYAWGDSVNPGQFSSSDSFLDSNGASTLDRIFVEKTTLTAGSSKTIILSSFLDLFNNTVAFSRINEIFLQVLAASDTPNAGIKIGKAATHPFGAGTLFDADTNALTIRNGGHIHLVTVDLTGYPVVESASDQLLLTNTDPSNPCTYNLVLLGHS